MFQKGSNASHLVQVKIGDRIASMLRRSVIKIGTVLILVVSIIGAMAMVKIIVMLVEIIV